MAEPLDLELNFGPKFILTTIVGLIISITAASFHWQDIKDFFIPSDQSINWYLIGLLLIASNLITFLIMHNFWKKEYDAHHDTKLKKENFENRLSVSEKKRLIDLITGIPNRESLEDDLKNIYSKSSQDVQLIFIDLKNFGDINRKYGQHKANLVLRRIARTIYNKMRRDEEMYKCPIGNGDPETNMYRVYPGGDEFAFIIFGDQAEALGFSNRLVGIFNQISKNTADILGTNLNLSFHCGIIEIPKGETYENLEKKIDPCYMSAKQGLKDFTICWFPNNIEERLDDKNKEDARKLGEYARARLLFEVMTPKD